MWELNSSPHTNPLALYQTTSHQIHILLVDHERESLVSTGRMLEMCSYKVTMVELASTALALLSNGMEQFDLVMANVHSPDFHVFKLLEAGVNMDTLVILMSATATEEAILIKKALEKGAFLFIQKPTNLEVVKYLWQNVVSNKLRNRVKATNVGKGDDIGMNKISNGKRKAGNDESQNEDSRDSKIKRKVCTEWTRELHAKFTDAVTQLGEGRCYPKDILDKMNVAGLTRMQVASHLQKCRNDNWRAPDMRKYHPPAPPPHSNAGRSSRKDSVRRFGIMPRPRKSYPPPQPVVGEDSGSAEMTEELGNKNVSDYDRGENSRPVTNAPQISLQSHFSPGLDSSVPPNVGGFGIFNGTSTVGAGNFNASSEFVSENEKSQHRINNGSGSADTTAIAIDMNSRQPFEPNLPAFGSDGTVTNSLANPPRRQSSDDFFDFMDILDNISELQIGSGANHCQNQQTYHFDHVFAEQFPGAMSMEARSHQGSKAAGNFGSTFQNAP